MPHQQDESGPAPLDGHAPFTTQEVARLRRLLVDDDRATWARKQLRIIVPLVVSVVVGAYQLWAWVERHLQIKP